MKDSTLSNYTFDSTGIGLSLACLVHCLALPALATIVPALDIFVENEMVHLSLLFILFPIALISFVKGLRKHQSKTPLVLGTLGLAFLVGALLLEEFKAFDAETILTFIGSMVLVAAHYLNIKYLSRAK